MQQYPNSKDDYFSKIITSLNKTEAKEYTPSFSVKAESDGWRIYDKNTDIAYFRKDAFDIWKFSPFTNEVKLNQKAYDKLMDLHTIHNTYLNLGVQIWPQPWKEQLSRKDSPSPLSWEWQEKEGTCLRADIVFSGLNQEKGVWTLTISYDKNRGEYCFFFDIHVHKQDSEAMECFNLMTAGALASTSEKRRWTHTAWENSNGEVCRFVHSTAFLSCTDFLQGTWRTKNLPQASAWVAYTANDIFNPCVLIHNSNVPVHLATCQNLFDEHICWSNAGTENLEDDAMFHFKMSLEIVNMGYELAQEILSSAKDPISPTRKKYDMVALPFYLGKENLFEQEIDIYKPQECPTFGINKNINDGVSWVNDHAYEGTHSICLTGSEEKFTSSSPDIGAVCAVEPHTQYCLSAWVKTENMAGYACLNLFSYEYTVSNIIATAQSPSLTKTNNWTYLEVELNSENEAYIMPKLIIFSSGSAWFDKIKLTAVSR